MLRLVPAQSGFALRFETTPRTAMGLISTLFLAASLATFSIYLRRILNDAPAKAS
jgi:hypothetical protein